MKAWLKRLQQFSGSHREGIALGLVIVIAVFFRFWQLQHLPPGLHPDEAANGLDIVQRIAHGDLRPLYDTNGPRESLFFFLQAIFVLALDNTILALRLAPALIGSLAVVMTYLLCKEWFTRRAAVFASLVMASGSWAVTISRDGYRAGMVPLMIPLTLWLITKAIKQQRWYWAVLAGVSFGAGFYTYINWRFTPLVILLVLMAARLWHRPYLKGLFKPALLAAVSAVIILIPLGIYGVSHPAEVLIGRSSVSFTNPELNHGQPAKTLLQTIGKTALMFNFKGDPNYRHNLSGEPMLNAFVGLMFVLGVGLSLRRIKDLRYFSLLAIFGIMLLPEILTAEGIPHGLRAIGVIPVVYIFSAIGISELLSRWRGVFPRNVAAISGAAMVLLITLLVSTYYDYQRYFAAWANDPNTFAAYSEDGVAIAAYLNRQHDTASPYVVVDGYTDKTIAYLTYNKSSYQRLETADIAGISLKDKIQIVVNESETAKANHSLKKIGAKLIKSAISHQREGVVLYRIYELTQPKTHAKD